MKKLLLSGLCLLCFSNVFSQSGCAARYNGTTALPPPASAADMAKMNSYDVHFYKLDLQLKNNTTFVRGSALMKAKAVQPMTDITLQLHQNMTVDSIHFNGSNTNYGRGLDILTIAAIGSLSSGTDFEVQVYYHGTPPAAGQGAIGDGFSNNAANKVTWSLSEPYSAYEWWPCKQILTDKADSSEVWITTDTINKAGSNGLLKKKVLLGNGLIRYQWKSSYPIAYYLISVAVCPYQEHIAYAHPAGSDSILVQNYLFKNATINERAAIDYTPALIETFSKTFGLYPFSKEKYGHCQAIFGGAMEHQTMTTMGVFDFGIVAHELGHHWFGDMVTCAGWSDIWLNEGFASYSELLAIEALQSPEVAKDWVSNTMGSAKYGSTVFVADSMNVGRLFSGPSTYKKGAILLRMLRYEINNDSIFFLGIRNYLSAHSYKNAFASDFKSMMEQTSGKNLTLFFNQWYYNEGHPVLSGQWDQGTDGKIKLQLSQTASKGNTVFITPIDVTFKYRGGDTTIRVMLDTDNKLYTFNLSGKSVYSVRVDKDDYILNEMISLARNPALGLGQYPEFAEVILYPNPASNQFTIANAEGSTLQITDVAGRQVAMHEVNEANTVVDISQLPAGIYIIEVSRNGNTSFTKLIKN